MFDTIASSGTILNPAVTSGIHDAILTILQTLIIAVSGGVAWLVKLAISRLKFDWQKAIAARVVAFAEMKLIGSAEKRQYVAAKLHEKFPRLTEEEISHLLEEAVLNLTEKSTTVVVTPQVEPQEPV